MGVDAWGFDKDRQRVAREFLRRRRRLGLFRYVVMAAFLVLLLLGVSVDLRAWLSAHVPDLLAPTAYLVVLFAGLILLGLPFGYVSGYLWEKEFGLTQRRARSWLLDEGKSFLLGLGATVVVGDAVLFLLAAFPDAWWFVAWLLGVLVSFVMGIAGPVVIAPMFFRFRPLADPALRARFEALAAKARVPVVGVFEMGASAKTRRSNAAVTGFGKTRRVIVTDTMLQEYTPDEVETVLAHELGHQRFRHPGTGFLFGSLTSLVVLAVGAWAYGTTFRTFGFDSTADVAALPLLALYGSLVSGVLGPLELAWSRRRESRADRFSLEITRNPVAFASAMVKLHDRNLGVADPKPWEIWLFYGHPPGRERVQLARAFSSSARSIA